jgi:TetR/AcrR family transcriptional regulator, transcriptional repressor for nem operon
MARSKEFETTRALRIAMDVFWLHGYENTSLELLMSEMGVAKQSLYDTFGDKRSLYFKAMALYREETNTSLRRVLASSSTVKQGFTKILRSLIAETREQHERGCLLLSANMERAVDDQEIAKFLQENQAEVESIFVEALRRAKSNGELLASDDPEALARFLIVVIQGMRAMARLKSDRPAMRQIAKLALARFAQ